MGAIFIKELKKILKDKATIFGLLLLPIVLIFVFGNILDDATNEIEVHYVDEDQTNTSKNYLKEITNGETFKLVEEKNKKEAIQKIKEGDLSSFVFIPKGFKEKAKKEEQIEIEIHYDGIQMESAGVVKGLVNASGVKLRELKIVGKLGEYVQNKKELEQITSFPIIVKEKEYSSQDIHMMTRMIPSYMIFFLFFMILNMSKGFVKDKETGMLSRLHTTPMKISHYLLGMMFAYGVLMMFQIVSMLLFGNMIYDISMGNVLYISLLSLLTVLCVSSIGLFVSMVSKNEQMANAISQAFALIGAIMGGVLIPIDLMPSFIQKISVFIPQYWAQKGYLDIMTRDVPLIELIHTFAMLLIYSLAFILMARLSFKAFMKKATH